MFLPGRSIQQEKAEKKRYYKRVEELTQQRFNSTEITEACSISVQEVQCGDPECSPIDTIVSLTFDSGGQGMFGVPVEAKDVTVELLQEVMPPKEIIEKWFRGEDAEWPPEPEPPDLRFDVGTKVQCRVGPTEWASGTVIQLWYRENSWPEGVYAPYKIRLNIGKDIYAPQDTDKMIRLDPNASTNDPIAAISE